MCTPCKSNSTYSLTFLTTDFFQRRNFVMRNVQLAEVNPIYCSLSIIKIYCKISKYNLWEFAVKFQILICLRFTLNLPCSIERSTKTLNTVRKQFVLFLVMKYLTLWRTKMIPKPYATWLKMLDFVLSFVVPHLENHVIFQLIPISSLNLPTCFIFDFILGTIHKKNLQRKLEITPDKVL